MNRLIISLFALVFASNIAFADGDQTVRLVHVSGDAEIEIPATIAEVSLGVESAPSPSAQEVQRAVAAVSKRLVRYLREQGIKEIQTRSINLSPRLEPSKNREELTTVYSAQNMIIFRTAPKDLGQMLDQAVELGATRIDRVQSFASDTARREAKNKAITKATAHAMAKAEAALSALGREVKEVVSVSIDIRGGGSRGPQPFMRMAANVPMQNTAYEAGTDSIFATVYLDIAY